MANQPTAREAFLSLNARMDRLRMDFEVGSEALDNMKAELTRHIAEDATGVEPLTTDEHNRLDEAINEKERSLAQTKKTYDALFQVAKQYEIQVAVEDMEADASELKETDEMIVPMLENFVQAWNMMLASLSMLEVNCQAYEQRFRNGWARNWKLLNPEHRDRIDLAESALPPEARLHVDFRRLSDWLSSRVFNSPDASRRVTNIMADEFIIKRKGK